MSQLVREASPEEFTVKPKVSVVILTFNEQRNIAAALQSCAWCDDVHVLDSGSTDGTRAIAEGMGAGFHINKFESFGQQRNWAIDNIPCKHDWHFHLDADERFTPELLEEIQRRIGPDGQASAAGAYLVPNRMIFMNRWIKHSAGYPAYQVRLFHRHRCRFTNFGHGQREVTDFPIEALDEPYLHHNFSKGLQEWLEKHNRYSTSESREGVVVRNSRGALGVLRHELVTGRGIARRRALKNLSYFLPFRGLLRYFHLFVMRLGFLDGKLGRSYCRMVAMYEQWIEAKIRESELNWSGRTHARVDAILRSRS